MDTSLIWLSLPEVAQRLGVRDSSVRELVRDGKLLAIRHGENNAIQIPEGFLRAAEDGGFEVLPTLHGTVTLLADAGLKPEEVMEWILTENEELGSTPLVALQAGQRARVRRVAQAQM